MTRVTGATAELRKRFLAGEKIASDKAGCSRSTFYSVLRLMEKKDGVSFAKKDGCWGIAPKNKAVSRVEHRRKSNSSPVPRLDENLVVTLVARSSEDRIQLGLKGEKGTWLVVITGEVAR